MSRHQEENRPPPQSCSVQRPEQPEGSTFLRPVSSTSINIMRISRRLTAWEGDGFCVSLVNVDLKLQISKAGPSHYPPWDESWTIVDWKDALTGWRHYSQNIKRQITVCPHGDEDFHIWKHVLWSDETKSEPFGHNVHLELEDKGGSWGRRPNCEVRWWQRQDVGMFYCRGDWWHHEDRTLCGNFEATSEDETGKAWTQVIWTN